MIDRKEIEKLIELDCGDSSCGFAKNRGGMRTNGGCRCFENAGFDRSSISSAHKMLPEILRLRRQLLAQDEMIRVAREALKKYANPETHSQDPQGFTWSGDYFDYATAQKALAELDGIQEGSPQGLAGHGRERIGAD